MAAALEVSVVVPTHNRAGLLAETLESITRQQHPSFEIIVIDDGSTDDTPRVMQKFGARIRGLRQENRGAAVARNFGAQAARGRFLAFCDDDDLWSPTHLRQLSGLLNPRPEVALAFSNAAFFESTPQQVSRRMIRPKYLKLLERRSLRSSDLFLKCIVTTLSVVMVARDAFESIGRFNERIRLVDDSDLALRISLQYEIIFLNEITCYKRILSDSLTATIQYDDGYLQVIEDLDDADPKLRAKVGKSIFRRRLASEYWKLGQRRLRRGDAPGAREAFRRACHWAWWNPKYHWNRLRTRQCEIV